MAAMFEVLSMAIRSLVEMRASERSLVSERGESSKDDDECRYSSAASSGRGSLGGIGGGSSRSLRRGGSSPGIRRAAFILGANFSLPTAGYISLGVDDSASYSSKPRTVG